MTEPRINGSIIHMTADGGELDTNSDDEWKRQSHHWSVILEFEGCQFVVDYWMGSGHVEFHRYPRAGGGRVTRDGHPVVFNHFGPGKDAYTTPKPPEVRDVLNSLSLDCSIGDQSFDDFCADLGYDTDSRKAYASWEACREQMFDIQRWLGGPSYHIFVNTDWEETP